VGRVVVVIGVGNEYRRDDGAGLAVVASLRGRVPPDVELVLTDGEPTRLIEAWTGAALAVVVDAVRADPPLPGRVHRFELDRPLAGATRTASSHGFGLDDAIRLALALDRMPGKLIVRAIEAADLTQGTGLTPARRGGRGRGGQRRSRRHKPPALTRASQATSWVASAVRPRKPM
jgi:hydrogenase maturation protease